MDRKLTRLAKSASPVTAFAALCEAAQPGQGTYTPSSDAEHKAFTAIVRHATRAVRTTSAPRRVNGPSGRPRASASRSSSRSGDSGSDDGPEPDLAAPEAAREEMRRHLAAVREQLEIG